MDNVINEIRKNVNIVDIISGYLPLTRRGKNYFGVCPFHDDHSPSMSVSEEKQIYTCFSCGATGNVFKFISDISSAMARHRNSIPEVDHAVCLLCLTVMTYSNYLSFCCLSLS